MRIFQSSQLAFAASAILCLALENCQSNNYYGSTISQHINDIAQSTIVPTKRDKWLWPF